MIKPNALSAHTRVSLRALLGIVDSSDRTDWEGVRAAQLQASAHFALLLFGANMIGAALIATTVIERAPLWAIASWGSLATAVSAAITFRRLSRAHREARAATARMVRDTALEGIALGAIWSIPALGVGAGAKTSFGIWIVTAMVMVVAAVAMAALPLAALGFLVITGAALSVLAFFIGGFGYAAATALFTVLLVAASLARGSNLMRLRAGEIALAERDETVSLLLREFEETDADWLWETDAAKRVIKASPRFAHLVGLDSLSINGMPFLQVVAGEAWESGNFSAGLRELAERLKGRDSFRDLVVAVDLKGEQRWWEISASPRFDEAGAFIGFRGVGSDITQARASTDKINRLARYDTLTGLPNRLMIHETLAQAMARAEKWGNRCAFMMIDLDRFKAVNDTLGHPVGDRLLGRVSERLKQMMTQNEMIGRLGGDEFAVVIADATDGEHVERLGKRIVEVLSRPYEVDHHTLYIGASVGMAIGPRDGRTAEMLIRSADLALYRSKDGGGGRVHAYEPQLHTQAEERRVLEIALRRALENGEMYLDYQPVVSAHDGGLAGFEALLRWRNPEQGQISPAKFVPIAEEAHLIAPIGEWVLRSACDEAARWPGNLRVSVNVSPEQLHNPEFVTTVASALSNSGLPASRLELEVTESVFMREGTCATQVLEKILDLGVRLSLDDFGTGYSSLGYLSRTRFSTIKVDRSFVTAAAKGTREAIAIIRAVVALADSLGMATTAEGVENEKEHLMVQKLGCKKVQGFYFGRPLPVEEARAIASGGYGNVAAA